MYAKLFPEKIYHATLYKHFYSIRNKILIDRKDANENPDFGKGFYTTTNKQQAMERAGFLERMHQDKTNDPNNKGIVITFDLNEDLLYDINEELYKVFDSADIEWVEFVIKNRIKKREATPNHNYFWTYGPMADGRIPVIVRDYKNGIITSSEQLLHGYTHNGERKRGLKPYKRYYDQLVFHDEEWVNSGVITNPMFELVEDREFVN